MFNGPKVALCHQSCAFQHLCPQAFDNSCVHICVKMEHPKLDLHFICWVFKYLPMHVPSSLDWTFERSQSFYQKLACSTFCTAWWYSLLEILILFILLPFPICFLLGLSQHLWPHTGKFGRCRRWITSSGIYFSKCVIWLIGELWLSCTASTGMTLELSPSQMVDRKSVV